MEVNISITVRRDHYTSYDDRQRNEATIEAEPEALRSIPWPAVCASLVEKPLEEAIALALAALEVEKAEEDAA